MRFGERPRDPVSRNLIPKNSNPIGRSRSECSFGCQPPRTGDAAEEEASEAASFSRPPCPAYAELLEVMERAAGRLQLPWQREREETARGRLDERFLSGHNPVTPVSLPFLPDLHVETEKAWKNPYSARIHTHQRSNFADVEGLRQHGICVIAIHLTKSPGVKHLHRTQHEHQVHTPRHTPRNNAPIATPSTIRRARDIRKHMAGKEQHSEMLVPDKAWDFSLGSGGMLYGAW
ncbi:hypothetical protein DPX16_1534 [Anabarilius grahami]|uniref:Uncharacterized protein n=1 Tax=Anabarilius grahami TaxID=495550 RepID=A0A3N0XUQ8_ANAGA|nr:hypothetical protein DPX16_1534 [Anabarilius grahami]